MNNERPSDMSDDEFVAYAERIRQERLARSADRPLGEVNWEKWADAPHLEFSGWVLHLDAGTSWQVSVDGRSGPAEVIGRRRVEDEGTDAIVVRRGRALLALRYEGSPDGWGADEHAARIETQEREVPVLAWQVTGDADPLPAPPAEPHAAVTVRPTPVAPRGGRRRHEPIEGER
jgi:hypothetical protein